MVMWNFKNMNKLAKHGLVNGLPSKLFTNEHNCVACNKGKQHKASYKAITAVSTISEPLQLLHMDLFGPTSIRSIDHKHYSLVVTDDFSRFSWVFFLGTKDETFYILRDFITFVENQLTKKVKAIRCDNGTEFKNSNLIELCGSKGIKRDYSVARTPQQNGTEAVSTACYVLNRVLVTRPHNKTPYELLSGKVPNISHLKPFGCHVTILNTSDHLGKFKGKADEGFLVGYSAHSKAYRVYNLSNKKIEETLNLRYMEDKPNVQGLGHEWYFDLDYVTDSLGYTRFKSNQPAGTQDTNTHAGTHDDSDSECDEQVIVVPSFPSNHFSGPKVHIFFIYCFLPQVESTSDYAEELARLQGQAYDAYSAAKATWKIADTVPAGSGVPATSIPAGTINQAAGGSAVPSTLSSSLVEPVHADTLLPPGHSLGSSENSTRFSSPSDLANHISSSSEMEGIHHHPTTGIFSESTYDADFGGLATNLAPTIAVDPVPTRRVHTVHPISQIIGDITSPVLTRGTLKKSKFGKSALAGYVHDQQRNNHTNYLHCLFSYFLSQLEPSSVAQALNDLDWVEAMQEEMQQFVNQDVWKLVPLPEGKTAIGTKRVLKNKRDARGIVVRNKARLVAQGHRQEEGIDYDEVFTLVARIEAIRLFLAFSSYMGFMVYQMDVKSAFLYEEINEEVYVTQPKGFEDPFYPKHVYRVVKALYGLHQAPRAWYARLSTFLLKHNYRRGTIDKTLFIKKNSRDIILVQVYVDDIIFGSTNKAWCTEFEVLMKGEFEMSAMDKYVQDMLRRFAMESVRPATTPYEAAKPKSKDEPDDAVNVHLYRSMIGSLMYLTASRPDIMFAVSACSRHQVTPLTSNLNAVKKIFKYLKGQPKLGLWYPRDSPFVLEAYSDSDYAGSNGDRKSTTGGCQFLGRRLISWQCKKQTVLATSSTEAEYVAAAHCCGQSTICIVKNPVFHQRTKHIEIRHHFIRDANEKNLIQVGFLGKPKGSADYHPVLDFLRSSHIRYAINHDPIIYDSLVKQFWSTASRGTFEEGPPAIIATIDRTPYTITESLVRSQLHLDDEGGVKDLPSANIYLGMDNMGYPTEGKLTFHKNNSLATALYSCNEGRKFNWSRYIFKGMVNNITNPKKFLMFPRFLQMILNIETRNSKQYHAFKLTSKMFANMRLNFHGDTMPLLAPMLPPAQPAIAGESSGEAEPTIPYTVPETLIEPAHSHDQASSPPRPTTIPASAQENEQGPFSDPNPASSSRPHAFEPTQFTSTNGEDDAFGGSFDISPPRSTEAPPAGTTSGGAEDPNKLTALCSLVNSLMQKIDSQASDLKAHKLMFKEVVGKLVKKVKELEDKLKGRKRKFVMTVADLEEEEEQDVDPLIKLAKAAATAADDSAVPTGGSNEDDIPPSSSIPSDGSAIPLDVTTGPIVPSFCKAGDYMRKKKLSWVREEKKQTSERQKDVFGVCKYYIESRSNGMSYLGQVHANQGLSADLLGPDVNEDNFAARMVALIAERRRKIRHALANLQSQHLRRSLKRQGADLDQPDSKKSKSTEPQKTYVPAASRPSTHPDVTPDTSKQPYIAPTPPSGFLATPTVTWTSGPRTRNQSSAASIKTYSTRRKSLGSRKMSSSEVDLIAADSQPPSVEVLFREFTEDVEVPSTTTSTTKQTASSTKKVGTRRKQFGRKGVHPSRSTIPIEDKDPNAEHKLCIKYASDTDSDSDDDKPINLHGVVDGELLPTGLGWVNVIYRKDNSRKCFLRLREILHDTKATGVGLVLWGDLKVLIDSPKVNDGSDVWKNQNTWIIQSWKLYSSTGIHVLETVSGHVLHMFVDKRYPLSVNLIERMLEHQLEICRDTVGNELTTAVQLIAFLKKQISDSRRPKVHDWSINLAAAIFVAVSILNALKTKDLSRKLEVNYAKFQFRRGLLVPTGRVIATVSIKFLLAGLKDLSRAEIYKYF
ncbi:putative ribonuclease H-like domain-containing protein [Tanacetum coccineum]|uniref:Ribonuclease H-like domain-containing protein n=1 Tax=Tanacetum coccineum TaxID=301880 RepID=A0ABQ4ZAQ1_9ASTR